MMELFPKLSIEHDPDTYVYLHHMKLIDRYCFI